MKKSTKIIIAVISIIVVIGAVVAVLFFTGVLDRFFKKDPKQAFYDYIDKVGMTEINYEDTVAKLNKLQTEPFVNNGKISMDVEFGDMLSDYADIEEVLNNIELSYNTQVDPEGKAGYCSINVQYAGEDLGTIEAILDDSTVGFRLADIYDKYLTFSEEEMLDSMDLTTTSMENLNVDELMSLLEISNDDITRIKDRYVGVLKDAIPEENYSSEKEKITVDGKEINATAYTVKLSNRDLTKILQKMLESLSEDDDTLDLVVEKINTIMEMTGEDTIRKSDLKSMIQYVLNSYEEDVALSDEKLEISVYEYKDATVRVSITLGEDGIIYDTIKDGDTSNAELKVKVSGTEMTLMNIKQTKTGEGKYTTTLSTDIKDVVKLEITEDTEETDSMSKANVKILVEVPDTITATINVEGEMEYKSVSIDSLTSSNSQSMTQLSDAEATQFAYGMLEYADSHMEIIRDIATSLGYEDEIAEFEQQINELKTQSSQATDTVEETSPDAQ